MTRSKDFVTGLITIALAVFIFSVSNNVKDFAAVGVGAGFLPRLASILLAVLGIVLAVEGWRRRAPSSLTDEPSLPPPAETKSEDIEVFGGWLAVLLSIGLMCAYVAFLDSLGFILTSTVYAFCQTLILAKNVKWNFLQFGVIALFFSGLSYFLFVRVFQVLLPAGILG